MEEKEISDELKENESVADASISNEEETMSVLAQFEAQLEQQKDKYIRLLAEFDNFKRRTAKERIELFKTAGQDLIKDLLPALDDAERAQVVINDAKDIDAVKSGLTLIIEKFKCTLLSKGLQEMECKGSEFNSDTMESITEIPAPSDELKGKVVEVIQKGYTLNDKIIRYAKVIVGK